MGGLLWFVLSLAAAYVVPAALANFSEHRRFVDGFSVGVLRRALGSRTYLVGWATAFAVVLVGGFVTAALNSVPVLGTVASAFVTLYALVAAYYVVGRTWSGLRPVAVRADEAGERAAV